MPAKRELTMRQIRQMLRLARDGVSAREIGRTLGVARSTIQDNLKRAASAGLDWPLPGELTDATLEQRLFAHAGVKRGFRRRVEPDWAALACELKRPGVNLMVLWEEYRAVHPSGYAYSRFCDLFREFERRLSPTMRQDHPAGDKVFVDYSGKRITIVDRQTGAVREAEIFVAVLGASNYTYAEATWTQTLPDWIEAHVRMFRFFGGVPRLVVPDNLKSGVQRASFYDPELNRSYGMMASHYGVGILPARPRKPRDKAKVEAGVRFAQTYILGRLRRQTFFSLDEANLAIAAAIERVNAHVMRRLGVSRRHLFEAVERPLLAPLPEADYQFAEWRLARVSLDYHVEVDGFFYSVPHRLIREQVDVRATRRTIELFHRGQRVAAHQRRYGGRRHGTDPDHMPSSHRRYAEWTPDRFRRWGHSIGPNTEGLVLAILANRPHPEQGFRTCLGVLRLFKDIRAGRARGGSRPRHRCAHLQEHRLDHRQQSRSQGSLRRRRRHRASKPARPQLLPLKDTSHAHSSHPRSLAQPRPPRHGQGLQGSRRSARSAKPRTCRVAGLASRT
jgi:transposase